MQGSTQADDNESPEISRTNEFTLEEAVGNITELPNTRKGTVGKVWATFHTDPEEVSAVCETAFKTRGIVMWKADRKDGHVSIALEKFAEYL